MKSYTTDASITGPTTSIPEKSLLTGESTDFIMPSTSLCQIAYQQGPKGNIPNHKRNLLGYSLGQTSQKETDEMPHICDYIKHIKAVVSLSYSKDIYLLLEVNAQKVGDPSKGYN